MEKRHELLENKAIVLLRFSSHLGIACNENVALEANVCLAFEQTHFMIPFFQFSQMLPINIVCINGKYGGLTVLKTNFLR